ATEISKLPLGFLARCLRGPPLAEEIFGFCFEVKPQFVIHISRWIRAKEAGVAAPKGNIAHWISPGSGSPVAASRLATASAYACQVFTSWRNWRLPSVVNR